MAIDPYATHNPAVDQAMPRVWRPLWHVGHLVYQAGVARLKTSSLTGGGFIPQRSLSGGQGGSLQSYYTPVASAIGGGQLPSRPNFLTPLLGSSTTSQF
jgi:hypothetical protein